MCIRDSLLISPRSSTFGGRGVSRQKVEGGKFKINDASRVLAEHGRREVNANGSVGSEVYFALLGDPFKFDADFKSFKVLRSKCAR